MVCSFRVNVFAVLVFEFEPSFRHAVNEALVVAAKKGVFADSREWWYRANRSYGHLPFDFR
jgi:hypothetical protein